MLGDVGSIVLAQNQTLTELYLSYNGIGDAAAMAFADNTTLRTLNLNYNSVKERGRAKLRQNKTLQQLLLSDEQPPEFTDENLDTIFLLSESFLCISDTKNTLQFFNPSFSRVLGYSSDELLAKPISDFLHPIDKKESKQQSRDKTPFCNYENRYRCKDGSIRTIRWTSHTKHDRQYAVGNDVTEQRRIEQEIRRADQHASSRELDEAKLYTARQSSFISELSHEIRNPLSGIMGLAEACSEQMLSLRALLNDQQNGTTTTQLNVDVDALVSDIQESLVSITACGEYQRSILNDNLDIVKISEGKFELASLSFDLKQTLREVVDMLDRKAVTKGVSLRFIASEEHEVWVKGDAMRVKQIFMNLVGNAVKFTNVGSVHLILRPCRQQLHRS